ncbi:DUF5684 domain-containing protein [Geomobilimonas luticola]|uniref:Uncharacterized protein n=1 Tax=Geomobilimonas luticola TaxID=1114878 RepID=A0ABS5SC79_9BACT|nr:DUF5684 domain-containing protein [Geomobilimonas luticola]MBT0652978.1 hypothetical protein [Geomobilimonas luticola]
MKKIWCLVVLLAVFIASDAMAARVFLKDGSVVQCQSFWRSKDTVYVMVNRDVMLEFSPGDVNIKKTFRARPVKKVQPVKQDAEKSEATSPGEETPATGGTSKPSAGALTPSPAPAKAQLVTPATAAPKAGTAPAQAVAAPAVAPAAKQAAPTSGSAALTPAKPVAVATSPEKPAVVPPMPKPAVVPPPVAEAAGMGFGMTFLLVPLLLVIILIASMWKVFEKAGEAGWKALIPIYNLYVLVAIAGKPWWWFLVILLVPFVGFILYLLVCLALAQRFGKSPLYGVLLCLVGFIMFPLLAFDDSTYA